MILTVAQQQFAVDHFLGWLANPKNLGQPPEDMLIDKIFDYDEKGYVILKFRKPGSEEWSFGVVGGFTEDKTEDSGTAWSEFEPYDEVKVIEKCKGYINMFKQRYENDIFTKIARLREEKKWDEIVSTVDIYLDNFKMPRDGKMGKCFQFSHMFDMFYYQFMNRGEKFEWVKNQEAMLLQRKLYALIELDDDKAFEVANELISLSPLEVPNMNEVAELYKARHDLPALRKQLEKMYPNIWNASQFAKYIRSYAWLAIEEGDIEAAVHYLSWSLNFDESENSIRIVENELNYIQRKFGFDSVPRPSFKKSYEYFTAKKLPAFPSPTAVRFCMNLYDICLRHNEISQPLKEEAKRNLIAINSVWNTGEVDAKMVEVNVLTPNKLIVNFKYAFHFQVDKIFKEIEPTGSNLISLQSEVEFDTTVDVRAVSNCDTNAQFEKIVEGAVDIYKKQGLTVERDMTETVARGPWVQKYVVTDQKGNKTLNYFTRLNIGIVGEITASATEDGEKAMKTILDTWQYIE